jgi:hypothetical protein
MKTNRNTKEYSRDHVIERAKQRYSIDISFSEYDNLCKIAKQNLHKCKQKEQNGDDTQYILHIEFKDVTMIVVFSEKRQLVTTLLPPSNV